MADEQTQERPWLLLVHQLPASPAYARVKLRRRLQTIGAVAVKKTVQALPASDEALEDFLWIAKELEAAGGEAIVCEVHLVSGVSDAQLRALFDSARDADYRLVAREAARLAKRLGGRRDSVPDVVAARARTARLRKRLVDLAAIDFFGANARTEAEGALRDVEDRLMRMQKTGTREAPSPAVTRSLKELRGKVWVTRRNVHVDRIACAWLVRRFIDPRARFRFINADTHAPRSNELRFDMADGEYTHRGDRCSFEVLLDEAGLKDRALRAMAQIVHDLDLKDAKFGRPEAEGVRQLMAGLILGSDDDATRLERGAALLDDLYRSLRGDRKAADRPPRTRR
jgi:hypothetical protein